MIIGIALVVDELHKGQRLVCRYPESIPSSILNSNEGLLKFHQEYHSLRCVLCANIVCTVITRFVLAWCTFRFLWLIFFICGLLLVSKPTDYSPDNFAKLFRPKATLFNKALELAIDDLVYISYPCPCSDELSSDTSLQSGTDVITLFNVVIATVRQSALQRLQAKQLKNIPDMHRYIDGDGECNAIYSCRPGVDPVATALGLTGTARGRPLRIETLKRLQWNNIYKMLYPSFILISSVY